ncbi:MAG: RagB/SusD family nutrient uptake outer membrane protein [Cyclobacteriaceae bacterium]|nr:RagB/SusD family nutrient uptake outer membrane protein [Cyclobacteriaceae bacterium]
MNNYRYLRIVAPLLSILIACLLASSCDESILEESPKGFLSPENAFQTEQGYDAAIAELHRLSRALRTVEEIGQNTEGDKAITTVYANGTDLAWFVVPAQNFFTNYGLINSTHPFIRNYWNLLYKIVANSNTVISNIKDSPFEEEVQMEIEARARFFRAYAYRFLVYLWGDVPLLKEELSSPKFDFARTPTSEVLQLMKEDLLFASSHLTVTNPGDGRLSKAAADHLLSETLISLADYDGAIAAASMVIEDPQYELMYERFGKYTNRAGDVFWDLFRLENQNRASGNTESILVWQLDFEVLNSNPIHRFTRNWAPSLDNLKDSKGKPAIVPADSLGRGSGFVRPTYYMDSLIWLSDFSNDIRNSSFNMQRVFYNNNPASSEFLKVIKPKASDLNRNHFVYLQKAASPEGYPQGYDRNGRMFTDIYAIRLAETYLLRAEAYIRKGELQKAADDINVVRNRAKATPVAPASVNIDYLLDERARELMGEEPRRLTLVRMNKLVERVRLYNPISSSSIQSYHNLWPIPQNEIDANLEADLGQNEGYE